MDAQPLAITVFFLTLCLTYIAAIYGRFRGHSGADEDLAGRGLNKWLIGLSAGTTGNSGFVVTGAVGLGYVGGAQWLLLPLGWFLGDLVYWKFFPGRINSVARETGAVTLSEFLVAGQTGRVARLLAILISLILVCFLSVYTSAQWLAGQKFLTGVFDMTAVTSLLGFGAVIVFYSAIGGFRGSIYADTFQAVIRIGATALALGAVAIAALDMGPQFHEVISDAGDDFFDPLAGRGFMPAFAFTLGFAGAALGFGLGQPQIITRYMAGESPEETNAARWIYIGFLQFTWVSMTIFGMILRGVDPDIADPETGLSQFFQLHMGAIAIGVIFADVFASIAGTANSVLVSIAQSLRRDILRIDRFSHTQNTILTSLIGFITIGLSFILPGSVYSIAITAVSIVGAALGGAVIIKVFTIPHTTDSLLMGIVLGLASSILWNIASLSTYFNEAGIGLVVALVTNYLFMKVRGQDFSSNR